MMRHGKITRTGPPGRWVRSRPAAISVLLLFASCLTAVAFSMLGVAPAKADTVPAAPSGWTTVFGDNFAGPAGSAPSAQNWFYDFGTGYGTGETEQTTNSTSNVYLDGNGHLVLKATDNAGTWTSGRIESTRDDFQAPPGGKLEMTAEIEQPNPANGLGYWPAFWALGSPMRTGGGWPQSGEIDMMEDVNAGNTALPGHPQLGNRLRHGLPDPGIARQHQLDNDLLHHHRHRREPDTQRDRFRPLHPDVRHRSRHPVRLLPVGVPGQHDRVSGP
jgi:Glycosyl hydrolases family 16